MARRVLMIGTSPATMGGIASVVSAYQAGGLFDQEPVTYLATHADGSWLFKFALAARALASLAGWLLLRPDFVLHVHASSRASFWRKCLFIVPARCLRKPVIFHLHGSEFMQFYRHECGPLRRALVRGVLNSCTKILVLSESWRKDLSSVTRNAAIEVLVNPAMRTRDGPLLGARPARTLLYLGRLGVRKGIYVLLAAVAAVKLRYPDVMLLCGGDGELDEVRAKARQLDILDNVRILGWVTGTEKTALLDSASIYVLPSFAEGLPMSVLEAMAAGLPVISTPIGGIPEAITHGVEGLLVTPGDPAALSAAICLLLGDPGLRERMGAMGHARFERDFSIECVLARLVTIYRGLGIEPLAAKEPISS